MPSSAIVTHENEAGDVLVGVERDGVFVPFTTVPGFRFEHYRERGENLVERAAAGDAEAASALSAVPATTKTSKRSSSSKDEG